MPSTKTLIAVSAMLALASFAVMVWSATSSRAVSIATATHTALVFATLSLFAYGWAMLRELRKGRVSSAGADRAG